MSKQDGSPPAGQWTGGHPKRFYETVEVRPEAGGHGIFLDGRPVKTPLKQPLVLPTHALADAVAAEWQAQEERIIAASMPLTKLANTSIDHGHAAFRALVDEFISYAGADLLCYRAEAPEGLVERQEALWDPLLIWVAQSFGARFVVATGIVHEEQPEQSLKALRAHVEAYDHFRLTVLQAVAALTGSAVIALALAERHISVLEASTAADVDEDWQIELWGKDDEAESRRAIRRAELDAHDRFMELVLTSAG